MSGVFQVEGAGMRRVLMEMKPEQFEHIVAAISLYRPGPMEYIPDYIKVLHKEQKPHYPHKILAPILEETMGVCVSGDALVTDAGTGRRYRLDELKDHAPGIRVQGIDEHGCVSTGRVSRWIDSGHKPVFAVTLRNGASIKVTSDHRLLTECGWRPLSDLKPGDYIGTPPHLVAEGTGSPCDRRRLRVLAYLIADGSLTSGTMADFVSKDAGMLAEYARCLEAFDNVSASYVEQVRNVTRIGAAKASRGNAGYSTPNNLLQWLRELGLKYPPGTKPGGAGSRDKFVPEFVFELRQMTSPSSSRLCGMATDTWVRGCATTALYRAASPKTCSSCSCAWAYRRPFIPATMRPGAAMWPL